MRYQSNVALIVLYILPCLTVISILTHYAASLASAMSKGEAPSVVESGTVLDAQLGKIRSSVTKMQSELTNYKDVSYYFLRLSHCVRPACISLSLTHLC